MSDVITATTYLPKAPDDAIPLADVKRVLIVKLRHHGDVLLASPVLSGLKRSAPHVEIDALLYDDTLEMLSLHPALAMLHCVGRSWKTLGTLTRMRTEWNLLRTLRQRQYDLLILLDDRWRGAWLAHYLGARWRVAPSVAHRKWRWRKHFSHLYTHPNNACRPVVEFNLDALRRIGIFPPAHERRLLLVPGAEAELEAGNHLSRLNLPSSGFIHIHPASRWRFKCWPSSAMAELINALQADGWPVVLTASPDPAEIEVIKEIESNLQQPAATLIGCLSLKALAALTARARLFVGVDSAPMHIAAAMQTPVVALFGPSGEQQWGPWEVAHRIVKSDKHACRPCGLDGCGGSKRSDCLEALPASKVLSAAMELLSPGQEHN